MAVIEYNIWKIVNAGRQKRRYYESETQFKRFFEQFKREYRSPWQAYRFTSEGWKRISKK